ncbi:MAG: glycosyltransferase family 2 protein [Cuspidothrix sp.]
MNNQLLSPLVSIIIPTYNRIGYLQEAITSAIQQTYQNIEIIVCDNCSSENPQSLIESFKDPRIKFHRHSENIGMLGNQFYGFKIATGKYVATLHDDDMWNEDFLAKLVPHLEGNPHVVLAFCDQYIIDRNSKINMAATEQNTRSYKRDQIREGIHENFTKMGLVDKSIPTAAACIIRNGVINWHTIPAQVGGMWDLYLTYVCCVSGYGVYYVPEKLTKYREHEQTDTMLSGRRSIQGKIAKAKSEIFCYQIFMEDKNLQEFYQDFKKLWLTANTTLGIGLLLDQQIAAARPYFWKTLQEQKFNFRTLLALTLSFIPPIITRKILKAA